MAAGVRHRLAGSGRGVVLMPRRNRNAAPPASPEVTAERVAVLAAELRGTQLSLLCAACCRRPATTGTHCAPCKGAITREARRAALKRR